MQILTMQNQNTAEDVLPIVTELVFADKPALAG
jgi:hypothetical protein